MSLLTAKKLKLTQ